MPTQDSSHGDGKGQLATTSHCLYLHLKGLMSVRLVHVAVGIGAVATLALFTWLFFIVKEKEQYTRERFAFVSVTTWLTMAGTEISALSQEESVWGTLLKLARILRGLPEDTTPANLEAHILAFALLAMLPTSSGTFIATGKGDEHATLRATKISRSIRTSCGRRRRGTTHSEARTPLELHSAAANTRPLPTFEGTRATLVASAGSRSAMSSKSKLPHRFRRGLASRS